MNSPQRIKNIYKKILSLKNLGIILPLFYTALILFLGLTFHKVGSYKIASENDLFSSYIPHAKAILEGNFHIDVYRGPVFTLTLALIASLINNFLEAAIIISSVSAGLFLYFTFKLIERIYSREAALFITIITAINPIFVKQSYGSGTDTLFIALTMAAVYFLLRNEILTKKDIILSGVFAGLSFLTRYNSNLLIAAIPVIVIIFFSAIRLKKRIGFALLFSLVFILTTSPWGIYTLNERGKIFYNENYRNIAISINSYKGFDWEESWNDMSYRYNSYSELFSKELGNILNTAAINFYKHFSRDMKFLLGWKLGAFTVAGLLLLIYNMHRRKNHDFMEINLSKRIVSYFLLSFIFYCTLLLVYYGPRFSMFLIPAYSLIAYIFIEQLMKSYKKELAVGLKVVILLIIISLTFVESYKLNIHSLIGEQELIKVVNASKKINFPDGEKIAAILPHVAYNLNLRWAAIPDEKSLYQSIKELKKKDVEYLYFSKLEWRERKELRKLINPKNKRAYLQPIIYIPDEPAVIYKIN